MCNFSSFSLALEWVELLNHLASLVRIGECISMHTCINNVFETNDHYLLG